MTTFAERHIPKEWELRRLKTVLEETDRRNENDGTPLLSLTREHGLILQSESSGGSLIAQDLGSYKVCNPGDLVMNRMQAWSGMFAAASTKGLVSPDYTVFRPKEAHDVRYLEHLVKTPHMVEQFTQRSKGIGSGFNRLYTLDFGDCRAPMPPPDKQAAIVHYLDHADELISRYISAKERLIALLEEQRKTVIHQAVTRGLHPNVSLTPSGIPSLGDVPAHWDLRRAKFTYHESDQRSYSGVEELMSVSHLTGVTPRKQNVTIFLAQSNEGYKLCRPGDIVVNTMWAYMAALGVARQSGLVSPSYGVYRPRVDGLVNPEYMDLLLRTENYRVEYTRRSKGITASRLRLYPDDFLDIPFLRPPTDEQTHIVKYLRRATANVDSTIDRTHRQIALMNEYRTRLIADVVTGELDVRTPVAQLPD